MTDTASRLGYHYYPDEEHYTARDLEDWLPILESLHAGWLVLRGSLRRAIPESFLRGLLAAGIRPIVHIPSRLDEIRLPDLSALLSVYAKWGLRHIVVLDRPNQRSAWSSADWARGPITELFVDGMLPILQQQHSLGLTPILPPLQAAGDYWDTAFLEATLRSLVRRGQRTLCEDLAIAIRAATYGHALSWGAGGPEAWPESRPYFTPASSQDHVGFHLSEWYARIAEKAIGHTPLMFDVAGGAPLAETAAPEEQESHSATNAEIARAYLQEEVPSYVVNCAFYLLAADATHADHAQAWFPTLDVPLPVVDRIRSLVRTNAKAPDISAPKSIPHFVLLPAPTSLAAAEEWRSIASFASAFKPTLGFDPNIAKLARVVSLAGDEVAIPVDVERDLVEAGCIVHRVPGITKGSLLDTLAASAPSRSPDAMPS